MSQSALHGSHALGVDAIDHDPTIAAAGIARVRELSFPTLDALASWDTDDLPTLDDADAAAAWECENEYPFPITHA